MPEVGRFTLRAFLSPLYALYNACAADAAWSLLDARSGPYAFPRVLACLILALSSQGISAAEWSAKPIVYAGAEFNDNKRLTTLPHDSVLGGIFDASAQLAVATEASSLNLVPRVRLSFYTPDRETDLDSEDIFFDFSGNHTRERALWKLNGNYTRDTTLTSELETTGLTQVNRQRQSIYLAPSVDYAIAEKNTLQLGFGYTDVVYEDAQRTGLVDYTYKTASLTDTHQLSEFEQVNGTLFVSRFEAPESSTTTDSLGLQLGYTRTFSESLKASLAIGFIASEIELIEKTRDVGPLFDVSVEKKLEATVFTGIYSRAVSPTGSGTQDTLDRLRLSVNHKISEQLDANLGFSFVQSETQAAIAGDASRDYARLDARIRYRLTEFWSLIGGYSYSRAEGSLEPADSNGILLTLAYEGEKWAISR